ncbi:MAG: NAD(P)-binding protein [Oscillospiraceae bacterium]|nr:NAD(P)-binding protein [Oscillospiraceae bacterium]
MKLEEITAYTEKCFNGEPATCSLACPFRMDVRQLLTNIAKGRWSAAYKTYRTAVMFPVMVSRMCPRPCLERCQRLDLGDEPIDMGALEKACVDYVKNPRPERYTIPPKTERIAVVGAGPAGLGCALSLALKKYKVTLFDKEQGWGGSLRARDDFAEIEADIAFQFSGVEIEKAFGREIASLDELADFDAVYVATGRGGSDFGLASSWDAELLSTSREKVFMGGEVCGVEPIRALADGQDLARRLEVWFQTGKLTSDALPRDCGRAVDHTGKEKAARVEVVSEETAMAEAARCLQCDCRACIDGCEMLTYYRKKPRKLAVEVYTDSKANPPIATHSMTRQAYSCNDCGQCRAVCPVGVDMGSLFRLSRQLRTHDAQYPRALHDYWLGEMAFHSDDAAFAYVPEGCNYIFFPGCRLSASYPDHVEKAYDLLASRSACGIVLGCCGAPAFWAGEEKLFDDNLARLRGIWEGAGRPTMVFACATCESLFARYLPEAERVSLYSLIEAGDVQAKRGGKAAVFDPCAARDDPEVRAAVRALASAAGLELEELKNKGGCCGYGGQMRLANRKLYDEIVANRAAGSELPYVVYCANCREVFAAGGKQASHILDLVFDSEPRPVPTIEQKRKNSLALKDAISRRLTGVGFEAPVSDWSGVKLFIPPDIQSRMDDELISADDVRETIWKAERDGTGFEREGRYLACLVTDMLTYWVEYEPEGDGFAVRDVYSHRMKFRQEV